MRTWSRAACDQKCGRCGQRIERGDPLQTLRFHSGTFVKVRCKNCGTEPAPADLPPLVERQVAVRPMLHIASGASALPLDWKARALGERDPGEEG
jgi:ribosomal protein S27E